MCYLWGNIRLKGKNKFCWSKYNSLSLFPHTQPQFMYITNSNIPFYLFSPYIDMDIASRDGDKSTMTCKLQEEIYREAMPVHSVRRKRELVKPLPILLIINFYFLFHLHNIIDLYQLWQKENLISIHACVDTVALHCIACIIIMHVSFFNLCYETLFYVCMCTNPQQSYAINNAYHLEGTHVKRR